VKTNSILLKNALCAFLSLLILPASVSAAAHSSDCPPVVVLRNGDLYFVRHPLHSGSIRRLTSAGGFSGVETNGEALSTITRKSGIGLLTPPYIKVKPLRLGDGWVYVEWLDNGRCLLGGRAITHLDADGGGWLVRLGKVVSCHKVLAAASCDFVVNTCIRPSPDGKLIAAGGTCDYLKILKNGSWTTLSLPHSLLEPSIKAQLRGSLTGFDWLNNSNLLISFRNPVMPGEVISGGLYLLNVKTKQWERICFPPKSDVESVCRVPKSNLIVVGLQYVDAGGDLPYRMKRIYLVDAGTGKKKLVHIPAPATVSGVSPDGSRLLLLMQASQYTDDCYIYTFKSKTLHLVAKNVTEAIWLQ
jgi:hypothetical protein